MAVITQPLGRTPNRLGLDALLVNKRHQISHRPHVHVVRIYILQGNVEFSPGKNNARRRKHDRNAFQTGGNNLSDPATEAVTGEEQLVAFVVGVREDGAVDVVGWLGRDEREKWKKERW